MLTKSNESLAKHIEEATVRRNKENEAYNTAAAEYAESIEAVEGLKSVVTSEIGEKM